MSDMQKEEAVKTSLKTVYGVFQECSHILDRPINQLEYLNEGDIPKEANPESKQDNNPTITLQMLLNMGHEISKKCSEVSKQCNHLTGQ